MNRIIFFLTMLFSSLHCLQGQQITGYEYWFDRNSDQRVKVASTDGNITLDLDVSTLSEGIHYYTFRAKDDQNGWSAPATQYFYRIPMRNQPVNYEYWFDNDVVSRQTANSANGIINLNLDVSALREGIHFITFRANYGNGNWSAPATQYFYRLPMRNQSVNYEYWFDNDVASRQTASSANGIIDLNLDVSALREGFHFITFRAKDGDGLWSAPATQYFYRMTGGKIVAYEYWLNKDVDAITRVDFDPVHPLVLQNQLFEFNDLLQTVTPGNFQLVPDVYGEAKIYYFGSNQLNIRFLYENGKWSSPLTHLFADGKGVDVVADTLRSNIPVTKTKPAADEIHFYKLNAIKGDSLIPNSALF